MGIAGWVEQVSASLHNKVPFDIPARTTRIKKGLPLGSPFHC
ncbi:hypothetical protein VCR14J2_220054 [Vibrio coralliirubri]|nr:hypothetical protein VCR15J2_500027 [Vibrio coralliirubri]CDT93120.1 hypothetical protein VCR14J2_220054 [Vibrio coralliirubri]CDT97670.1 hypothetical protein VCR3J2_430057 [Vibrio coralliirubri]CDT98616.1 hypothetical protein VCR12J2_600055 [Vibrio coralliirubri]